MAQLSPRAQTALAAIGSPPTLSTADVYFDASRTPKHNTQWRAQTVRKASPRLLALPGGGASASSGLAELAKKSDGEVLEALLDNHVDTSTFIQYLQQSANGSPARLLPWLQMLSSLASKVGTLLESTRFLCTDLQLARIVMHMQTSSKALCGAKRARALMVHAESGSLLRVGDRGEVLMDSPEPLATGTSFAAHCARSGRPLLIGLPGSAQRTALQFNVDSGIGSRPETTLLVPCLDHTGKVLAVIQLIDKQAGVG